MRTLMVIPAEDFDPTEAAVPWKVLRDAGIEVVVSTPNGQAASADSIVLTGNKLGLLKFLLRADQNGRIAYQEFLEKACPSPLPHQEVDVRNYDALILPGGHAPKMRAFLESTIVHEIIGQFFKADKIIAAICHGVIAVARTQRPDGKSILYGKKTTALTEAMEIFAWKITRKKLGDYYRTYPQTVQSEVTKAIGPQGTFLTGPAPLRRDKPNKLNRGFVVQDGNYISARYPGDIYRFSATILETLNSPCIKK